MSKIIAHISLVVLLGVGACAPLSQVFPVAAGRCKIGLYRSDADCGRCQCVTAAGIRQLLDAIAAGLHEQAPVRDARVTIDDRTVSLLVG